MGERGVPAFEESWCRATGRLTAITAVVAGAFVGCTSSAPVVPPAPAEPVVVTTPAAAAPAATPAVFVKVSGSRLNVRESPTTSARTVTKVPRGTRLQRLDRSGDWLQVALEDGTRGWVHGKYVVEETPCRPDSTEPEIAFAPPVGFIEGAAHGRVVIEATVSRSGDVTAIEVTENTTGSEDLVTLASGEVRQMKFVPFIRKCRPVSFIYVYTRTY